MDLTNYHLNYCSVKRRGYDEVSSFADLEPAFVCKNTFCAKYESKTNIFAPYVRSFANLDYSPELPSADTLNSLKIRALYDFCNANGLYINDKTDLLKKYEVLKDEITHNKLFKYDIVKNHYAEIRAEKSSLVNSLKEVFALGAVDDVLVDLNYGEFLPREPENVLQDVPIPAGSSPQLPKPVIQMNIFNDDEDDIPCF